MSRITIESINEELKEFGWSCVSETYKNLETNEIISGAELRAGLFVKADIRERYGKTFYFKAI